MAFCKDTLAPRFRQIFSFWISLTYVCPDQPQNLLTFIVTAKLLHLPTPPTCTIPPQQIHQVLRGTITSSVLQVSRKCCSQQLM